MLKIAVLVSGGGTNLQAIIDSIENGAITNAEISVVISNNAGAYALERARKHGIEAVSISPKNFADREKFNCALLEKIQSYGVDLIVLAGFLVVVPKIMVDAYPNRIIIGIQDRACFELFHKQSVLSSLYHFLTKYYFLNIHLK